MKPPFSKACAYSRLGLLATIDGWRNYSTAGVRFAVIVAMRRTAPYPRTKQSLSYSTNSATTHNHITYSTSFPVPVFRTAMSARVNCSCVGDRPQLQQPFYESVIRSALLSLLLSFSVLHFETHGDPSITYEMGSFRHRGYHGQDLLRRDFALPYERASI